MDINRNKKAKPSSFFDQYAHEYDYMTDTRARTKLHRAEIQSLIDDFAPRSVLDAGCGTGLSSMLLAQAGIKAVGLDHSQAMLKTAAKNYGHLDLPLSFRRGSFEALPDVLHDRFDLVISLANSVSGLSTHGLLSKAMRGFYRCLKPGGRLVIQMLNFTSLEAGQLLPIRATRHEGLIYIRYALRQGRRYALHIVRIDNSGKVPRFEPFSHEFDNFTPAEVTRAMKLGGFVQLSKSADLQRTVKFAKTSRDLVLVGRRAA